MCRRIPLPALALAVGLILVLAPACALASRPDDLGLRDVLAAERALAAGDLETFTRLLGRLAGHPLLPYVRFAALRADPAGGSDAEIERFLADHGDTPLAGRLRPGYLDRLAGAGRWADYARVFEQDADPKSASVERQCAYLQALLETGRADEALRPERMEPIWLHGRSRPDACDPAFAAWEAAGGLTPERVWGRIRLALEADQPGLARYLGKRLPEGEAARLDLWLALRQDPSRVLGLIDRPARDASDRAMVLDGVARLARSRPRDGADALERLVRRGGLDQSSDPDAWDAVHGEVAWRLARSASPADRARAWTVWDRLTTREANLDAQERRLRAAVAASAWEWVIRWVEAMPAGETRDDRWLYWLARAQEALGLHQEAVASYVHAAGQRSLWGFLAADRVGRPYALDSQPLPADPARIAAFMAEPAMARIQALRALGRETDMRREWRDLTADLDHPGRMAAASVADSWGWHDQAIFTLAPTGYWDDLALRFPLRHRELVAEQAWQTALPEEWIFAVIRQESVFNPTVASHAGALGLMQLMPGTAREVARELEPPVADPGRLALLDPELNITLGANYLAWMRDRFGHPALATAAYNAGPHRVRRWLPEGCTDADLWILAIPFTETRGYVERVLAYRVIYRHRLGLPPERLSEWLPPIPSP